jgi:DNA-binding NtrC family response regulator
MKILFVDDNDTFREMLQYALESFGYVVETACDGLAGLEKLEEEVYDLLITDNHMPRMGGLKLIEETSQREMNIKTVLISGDLTSEAVESAKERGVCECLPKPFSLDVLRETVLRISEEAKISKRKLGFNHPSRLLEAAGM